MDQTITIRGRDSITIVNSQGKSLNGWTWDGAKLSHPLAATPWTATPDMAARIEAALAAVVPASTERKTGAALSRLPEAERAGFEWDGRMDGNGGYVRTTPASFPAPLHYTPADFGR